MGRKPGIREAIETAPAEAAQLACELRGGKTRGLTNQVLLHCPAVLGLAVVAAKAASESPADRAVAARNLLVELTVRVDGERLGPVATLLGLASGSRGSLLKTRRATVAAMLGISVDHLRTSGWEDRLIEALADELFAADSAYRLRHRHRTEREREPLDNRVGVNWLERHQAYRRVWTPMNAARADVAVLLQQFRDRVPNEDIGDRLTNICWQWARFQIELESFIRDYGGLWLLGDVESEFALADALEQAELLAPGGEADHSWLRGLLRDSPHLEFDPFRAKLLAEELGEPMLVMWADWAKTCQCNLAQPAEDCPVHAWMSAVTKFTRLMDEDWIQVADWYRRDPGTPPGHTG